ncbi:hypothetical protein [Cellulomonas telluris]|uniref:hypothetical protein n=1 Tax=Cellulomonas telluris TaxID=2306636 RepID=UPI0010A89C4B|nr:hypothetical protein [Cellulomonas telluris]
MTGTTLARLARYQARLGVALVLVCAVLVLAPTSIQAKQSGDPALACLDLALQRGETPVFLEQPQGRFDRLNGTVTCTWHRASGTYRTKMVLGADSQRLLSRAGTGLGLRLLLSGLVLRVVVRRGHVTHAPAVPARDA